MQYTNLLLLLELLTLNSASLLLALALLQEGLGNQDLVLGGNGTVEVSSVCPQKKNLFASATFRRV